MYIYIQKPEMSWMKSHWLDLCPSLQRPDPQKVRHRQRWLPGFPLSGLSFNSDGFSRQNTTEPGLSPCCPYSMIFFIVFLGDCSTIADTAMSDVATEVLEIFVVRWFGIHPSLEGCQGIVWFSDAGPAGKWRFSVNQTIIVIIDHLPSGKLT